MAHRLHTGLGAGDTLRNLIETIQPVRDKVVLLAYPWGLPILVPDSQATGLSGLVRLSNEPFLIIRHRDNVRTDLLQPLGEVEVLTEPVSMARYPDDLSFFTIRYYNPHVVDGHMSFLAAKYRDPFLYNFGQNCYYSDNPYSPHEGLYHTTPSLRSTNTKTLTCVTTLTATRTSSRYPSSPEMNSPYTTQPPTLCPFRPHLHSGCGHLCHRLLPVACVAC